MIFFHVIDELFLYSNNFYGGIPSSLPSGLIKLRLYDNPMTGELTIGDLAQLEELEIDNMGLEGQLPDFSGLVSLKQFYAHANDFDGPIADIFDGLTNLSKCPCASVFFSIIPPNDF